MKTDTRVQPPVESATQERRSCLFRLTAGTLSDEMRLLGVSISKCEQHTISLTRIVKKYAGIKIGL